MYIVGVGLVKSFYCYFEYCYLKMHIVGVDIYNLETFF